MQEYDSQACDGLREFHQGVLDSRIRESVPTILSSSESESNIHYAATDHSPRRTPTVQQRSLSKHVYVLLLVPRLIFAGERPGECPDRRRPYGMAQYEFYRTFHRRGRSSERVGPSLGGRIVLALPYQVRKLIQISLASS